MKKIPQAHGGSLIKLEKGETNNPNGRPRKLIPQILKELQDKGLKPVSSKDIVDTLELVLNMTEADIVDLVNNKETPYYVRVICSSLTSKAKFEIFERIIDRAHGRVRTPIDLETNNPFLALMMASSGIQPELVERTYDADAEIVEDDKKQGDD